MFVVLLTLLLVLICAHDYWIKSSRVWRHLSQFPGEPALPLIGNALQLGINSESADENMKRLWEKHGRKNFRLMMGTEPMLMVCELDAAKKILGSNVEIQKSEQQVRMMSEAFGESLAFSRDEKWRKMRKILTPVFHFKLLEQYLQVANSEGVVLVDKLRTKAGGPAFDIFNDILTYNLDVIYRTTLGVHVNAQSGGEQDYVDASRKILPLVMKRFVSLWYRYDFFYKMSPLYKESQANMKIVTDSLDRIIDHRKSEFVKNILPQLGAEKDINKFISNNRGTLTFIDILLMSTTPEGNPISAESIRKETMLIIFAGFDTTLTSICFALSNLAKYKDLQERVYQEQLEIFGDDLTREPTMQDLNEMKYLQRFVKESMRMFPTVVQYGRYIQNDIKLDDGKVIAAGTNVTFYVPGLHSNPEYFPDPHTFNPDRFEDPTSIYSYVPFSAGPRNCIGMNYAWLEMRTALSKIVRNFEVSLENPEDFPVPINEFVLSSKNGFKVKLAERKRK